jgi:hypothetical protein
MVYPRNYFSSLILDLPPPAPQPKKNCKTTTVPNKISFFSRAQNKLWELKKIKKIPQLFSQFCWQRHL